MSSYFGLVETFYFLDALNRFKYIVKEKTFV